MKILPVSFTTRNINSNPHFEAKYDRLKQIKDLPCACCGKPVLNPAKFFKAFTDVAKPLSYCLKHVDFSWLQDNIPKVYALLVQFAQEQPKASINTILDDKEKYSQVVEGVKEHFLTPEAIEETTGNAYATKQLNYKIRDELTNLKKRSMGILKSSSVVIKKFAPMKKYLQGTQKEVFEQFEIYAKKYPKLRLSEITHLDEVYKFHKAKNVLQRSETNEKLNFHLGNIEELVLKSNPDAEDKLYELKDFTRETIANEFDEDARLPMIKNAYEKALVEFGCEKLKSKVFDELNEIPLTFITKDSKIVRFKELNFSDNAILDSIFAPFEASDEHNKALSCGGEDNIFNITVMHRLCNRGRGNRPYEEHLAYHRLMPYYTQQQFDRVSKEILTGNLSEEYVLYPTKAAENLRECSNGKININVEDYCKKQIKKTKEKTHKNIEEKAEIRTEIGNIEEEIRQLQEKAKALEERRTEINRENKANKFLRQELENYQESKK